MQIAIVIFVVIAMVIAGLIK
jgi:hypothetical protein